MKFVIEEHLFEHKAGLWHKIWGFVLRGIEDIEYIIYFTSYVKPRRIISIRLYGWMCVQFRVSYFLVAS